MTLTNLVKSSCLAAALLLMPAPGFGAHRGCQLTQSQMSSATCPCAMNSASTARRSQKEASMLLKYINRDAYKVRSETGTVQSEYPYISTGWEIQADELTMIRDDVNDMGQRLCRLENIHDQLTPTQQKAVDAAAPLVKDLAIFTTDAIHYVNGHRDGLWNPIYRTYIQDIRVDATHVPTAVNHEG